MNKHFILPILFSTILVLSTSGCTSKNAGNVEQGEIIYQETSTVAGDEFKLPQTGNPFKDHPTELSDVRGSMGGIKKTGQSEIIHMTKQDFESASDEEFAAYVSTHESMVNDWFAIVFDDQTAILLLNSLTEAKYGTWDDELGITEPIGVYEKQKDGTFKYHETP